MQVGKVKLIYIDPPYNTGSDFVYSDDYAENTNEFLIRSNQVDSVGGRLVVNSESNGRFHSDWLSMMYSRLRLARNLLKENGAIFVSIDDHERDNLKRILDEVFGESNFLGSIIWRKKASPDARSTIGSVHDYILAYVRNGDNPKDSIGKMSLSEKRRASFTNPDNDPRGPWASVDMTGMIGRATKDQFFKVTLPSGRELGPPEGRSWGLIEKTFDALKADKRIWFGLGGDNVPRVKQFLSESEGQTVPTYWGFDEVGSNEDASNELLELFKKPKLFDTPKPTALIERVIEIATKKDRGDIVLDFFAGSCTTAHATLKSNAKDGGNRKYIMVQIDDSTDEKSEAFKAGYKTIAEISKERIRRAGQKVLEGACHDDWSKDAGIRVLKVDTSNMADVYYSPDSIDKGNLDLFVDNIKSDRNPEDLLFQVMLDWGVDLTLPIAKQSIQGKDVFFVDGNVLAACFDASGSVDEAFVKELAKQQPLRVVFRDAGYKDSAAKINVEQIFKLLSPATEVKCI
ncbi:site-specific DNA-methyltransferase [Pseudomonas helleri]|uniref:site-specific DNA-methyltransferase (adenine-specific) n=1 Tax=Pseudomonas helleri TaxID=1608996 RepID=A0A7X1WDJ0_9PSED|nr:site-specific DNA-methyltransferase [Pseudomonas helleri]